MQTANLESTLRALNHQVQWIKRRMEKLDSAGSEDITVQAINAVLNSELVQAKHAVSRAMAGNYGICERCRRPIDRDRLKSRCVATTCTSCEKAPIDRFTPRRGKLHGEIPLA
jgi:RNA polymerase-binding transcription factor DksA